MTPDEKEIYYKATNDLYYFAKHILGYSLLDKAVHGNACETLPKEKNILIMYPRDCFKTTIFVIAYSIWLLVQNSDATLKTGVNEKILISRKTYKEAKKILSEINQQFKNNQMLKHFYGSMPGKYNDEYIELERDIMDKDHTVTISGLDNSITGGHFTRILNDDLVNRLDRKSKVQRENTLGYCKDLINMKDGNNTQNVYIGTRWHLNDIYSELIDNDLLGKFYIIKEPLIKDDKVFFPTRFPQFVIDQLKKDVINWNSQYILDPLTGDVQIYDPNDLNYYEGEIKGDKYLYYDGAEGKKDSDYTSIIEGTKIDSRWYITEWFNEKWDVSISMDFIAKRYVQQQYKLIVVEANRDSLLKSTLIERIAKLDSKATPAIKEIKNTSNKEIRIESMQPTVLDYVYFLQRKKQSKTYETGFSQLISYPVDEYDDAPDALEGLIANCGRYDRNFDENDKMITATREKTF